MLSVLSDEDAIGLRRGHQLVCIGLPVKTFFLGRAHVVTEMGKCLDEASRHTLIGV